MIEIVLPYGTRQIPEIKRGKYEDHDPRLHGLADYLVRSGHAIRLSEPEQIISERSDVPTESESLPEDRDTIKRALDDLGIEYNARRSTAYLQGLLEDALS